MFVIAMVRMVLEILGMGDSFHKILLVDDSESNRVLVELYLEDHPYFITCASNGIGALKCFEIDLYDCILMDVEMPGMNGFEVVEKMRSVESQRGSSETPVIFLTAHDRCQCINEVVKVSNSKLLTKPIRRVDLLNNLHEMIEDRE